MPVAAEFEFCAKDTVCLDTNRHICAHGGFDAAEVFRRF